MNCCFCLLFSDLASTDITQVTEHFCTFKHHQAPLLVISFSFMLLLLHAFVLALPLPLKSFHTLSL